MFRNPSTIDMLNQLVRLYEAWDKPEKAEEWRAKLPKTEAEGERHKRRKDVSFKS